jgi:glycosyltransferase 2 family protein
MYIHSIMKNIYTKTFIKVILPIIISAFFLWLSMKDVKFIEILNAAKKINLLYLFPLLIIIYTALVFRTLRWQILLSPFKIISYKNLFSTLIISLMMLLIFPARIGEFARAYIIGKKENISKATAFSTIVVERILDGCTAILLFLTAVLISPVSSNIEFANITINSKFTKFLFTPFSEITMISPNTYDAVITLTGLILFVSFFYVSALLFVILLKIFNTRLVNFINKIFFFLPSKINNKITSILTSFILGINCFKDFKSFLISILYSFIIWSCSGLMYWVILLSFGLHTPIHIGFIIFGFVVVGVMIPAAPGFIGTVHFVIMQAFSYYIPYASASTAASYAWIAWALSTFFVIFLGLFYFKKENIKMKEIQKT